MNLSNNYRDNITKPTTITKSDCMCQDVLFCPCMYFPIFPLLVFDPSLAARCFLPQDRYAYPNLLAFLRVLLPSRNRPCKPIESPIRVAQYPISSAIAGSIRAFKNHSLQDSR